MAGFETKEAVSKRWHRWYEKNKEALLSRHRRYYDDNKDRFHQWKRTSRKKNPQAECDRVRKRRARMTGAPISESISKDEIWERDNGICHICGTPANPNDWHLDHIVPLARGGSHTRKNVAVSHPVCNMKKGTRIVND